MKGLGLILLAALAVLALGSCDGRSGYLDDGQERIVALLTDVEWMEVYADYGLGNEVEAEDATFVYSFDRTGSGWVAAGSLIDEEVRENVRYFRWAFTTGNFAVIQTAGGSTEGYWLIQKLTADEMWLQWSVQDPVYFPNQTTTMYKFRARKRCVQRGYAGD